MQLVLYKDIVQFTDEVLELLMTDEIQNNIILPNCYEALAGKAAYTSWLMATMKGDEGKILLIAMMTPPYNLVLYAPENHFDIETIDCFVKELEVAEVYVYGIMAERSLAKAFVQSFDLLQKKTFIQGKKMRIFKLDQVKELPKVDGRLRIATKEDLFYLPYWHKSFHHDCGQQELDLASAIASTQKSIENQVLFLWQDGHPVSQTAIGRKTPRVAVMNAVYTPPHYRGRGYATACVASLSKLLLETGFKQCSLFTDLENPISNRIYMKMGYQPVCDVDEYKRR